MPAVSETIVREFFELNGFLVRQPRKFTPRAARERESEEADLLVVNPHPQSTEVVLPFLLRAEHLPNVARAVVVVKGWHTETFTATRLTMMPEIFRFTGETVSQQVAGELGDGPAILKILVVPSLPHKRDLQQESIRVMRDNGVDAAIPFRTILSDLFRRVEVNRDYQKSDLLQTLRILKAYELVREPQLELFRTRRRSRL